LLNHFRVRRQTATKRLRADLAEVKHELALRRQEAIPEQGKWLRSVVRGHFNYHAVPGNTATWKHSARKPRKADYAHCEDVASSIG
jgi:hypothetical protein